MCNRNTICIVMRHQNGTFCFGWILIDEFQRELAVKRAAPECRSDDDARRQAPRARPPGVVFRSASARSKFELIAGIAAVVFVACMDNTGAGVATETRSWSPLKPNAGVGGIDAVVAQEPRPDLKPCALEHRLKQPSER